MSLTDYLVYYCIVGTFTSIWGFLKRRENKAPPETRKSTVLTYLFFFACWFIAIPCLLFYSKAFMRLKYLFKSETKSFLDESNLGFEKPDSIIQTEIENLILELKENSEKNQKIHSLADSLSNEELNDYYISTIKPSFQSSRKIGERFKLYLDSNLDLRHISVNGISPYDADNYYLPQNFLISKHSEREQPYVELEEDIYELFGTHKNHYMPSDIDAYLEERKKVKKIKSDWEIFVTPNFKKSFRKVSNEVQKRAFKCIEEILIDPRQVISKTCMPLSGNKKGLWRYRFGDYRILYEPDRNENLIIFLNISSRAGVYEK